MSVMSTVKVPQIQFIAGVRGHSYCATETGTMFSAVAVMAAMKGFLGLFIPFFALLQVAPELSASFRSPRWRRVLCHRGLLHNFILRVC